MPLTTYSCAKCMSPFKENSEVVMGGEGLHCPRCSYMASIRYLKNELPSEFFNGGYLTVSVRNYCGQPDVPSPAARLLDEHVVREHSRPHDNDNFKEWLGPHKNVHCWWELENGKAVAWNEDPSKGWSFPVITLHSLKVWNGRGDFGYNGLDGHLNVCADSRKEAVQLLKAAGHSTMTLGELDNYYNPCWGISMSKVKREKGVWFEGKGTDIMRGEWPKRLI